MTLLARVFALNTVVVVGAAAVLVSTPATVSFPIRLTEAAVLGLGLAGALSLNLVLLRRLFQPLVRLTRLVGRVDPLSPGARVPADGATAEVRELTTAFNDMLERMETERRESARRALTAEAQERRRIARDLHDELGQMLTVAMLDLDVAARSGDLAAIERARAEIRTSAKEVRQIARRVRPELLDDLGLASALRALAVRTGRDSQVDVNRRIDSRLPALSADEELVIYRVAQEALTNAARHGEASRIEVRLGPWNEGVELYVGDDGHGFQPSRSVEGDGIRGMRERALLIGADLIIQSEPGCGTEVSLKVTR